MSDSELHREMRIVGARGRILLAKGELEQATKELERLQGERQMSDATSDGIDRIVKKYDGTLASTVLETVVQELRAERAKDEALIQSGAPDPNGMLYVMCRMSALDAVAASIERALSRVKGTG